MPAPMKYDDRLTLSRRSCAPQSHGRWPGHLPCPWCGADLDDDEYEPWDISTYHRILTCDKCERDCTPMVDRDSITLEGLRSVADLTYLQATGKLSPAAAD